jgi:hypothetical protein
LNKKKFGQPLNGRPNFLFTSLAHLDLLHPAPLKPDERAVAKIK